MKDDEAQHINNRLSSRVTVSGYPQTFRRESPAAAAASTSSSHSSDAAELHLTDKTQQDPGAQLLSDDTPK